MLKNLLEIYSETLHPSRLECLKSMITGMLVSGNIQMSQIARNFKGEAQPESIQKRITRFLDGETQTFEHVEVARWISETLNLKRISKWTLVIDRTNWKCAETDRNLLVLGVLFKNVFVPLIAPDLGDLRSKGNSSTEDRKLIMDIFRKAFSDQEIKELIADREFIGEKWFEHLEKELIPYVIRLKDNWDVVYDEDNQRTIPIKDYIKPKMGNKRVLTLENILLGSKNPKKANVTAFYVKIRNGGRELAIVRHSKGMKSPQREYKRRWKIECCFKHLKTGGFNLESSHLKNQNRFELLVRILFMCFAWVLYSANKFPDIRPKANCTNRLSYFRLGLEKLLFSINRFFFTAFSP